MPLDQFSERILRTGNSNFTHSLTPGTYYLMFSDLAGDLRIDTMQLVNSDNIDHNWSVTDGGGGDQDALGAILVPARAGYDGIPSVDALAAIQPVGYHYLMVPTSTHLEFTVHEAVTAGAFVTAYWQGGQV